MNQTSERPHLDDFMFIVLLQNKYSSDEYRREVNGNENLIDG